MASGNVVSKPEVTFTLLSAPAPVQNAAQRILIVGQVDDGALTGATPTAGSATGEWVQNIGNSGEEDQLFGARSQLAEMVRTAKLISKRIQIDAIAIDDAGGTHRSVECTIAGTAAAAGDLRVVLGSEKLVDLTIPVLVGDTATAVAAKVVAAVQAATRCRYWATNALGVITFTSINDGIVANGDPILVQAVAPIAGITVGALANTDGTTDPTTTNTLDVIGDTRYQTIIWPYVTQADDVQVLLDARFNTNNAVLNGVAFVPITSSFAGVGVIAAQVSFNSPSVVGFASKLESSASYLGPSTPEAMIRQVTMFAAIRALRLTRGEVLTQYLTSLGARDQFGGSHLASLPYFNTVLPAMGVPRSGLGWTTDEIGLLLAAGIGVIGQNPAGSAAIAGEVPTTYLTNGAGNPDATWHFLNAVDTASEAREYIHNNVKARFAQSRLTDGDTPAGHDITNAGKIKAYLVELYAVLSGQDYVLVQDGQEAKDFFKRNVVIDTTLITGTVTITMLLPIVVQLRRINASITIAFDTNG